MKIRNIVLHDPKTKPDSGVTVGIILSYPDASDDEPYTGLYRKGKNRWNSWYLFTENGLVPMSDFPEKAMIKVWFMFPEA